MERYEERYKAHVEAVERALEGYFAESGAAYQSVVDAMRYSVLGAGKRVRAVLLLEFCGACGGSQEDAVPFACAVEMIHAYSLVHDDLPCMDNDRMRRGKPSCWAAYGETTALLAGDGLLTRAFEAAAGARVEPARALRAAALLARRAGSAGMLGGQVIDLESEGRPVDEARLLQMYAQKTGALLCAAAEIGCIVGGGSERQIAHAHNYAEKMGLAFQIVDDILDVAGSEEALGKPVGSDAESGKTTYVTLHPLEAAREEAMRLTAGAKRELAAFHPMDEFLSEFTDRLAVRDR